MPLTKFTARREFDKNHILYEPSEYHWNQTAVDNFKFSGNINYQWSELLNYVLDTADSMPSPNGYYWGTEQQVFVVDKDITNDIAGKETRYQVDTGYNQHNTQFYKLVNQDLGKFFDDLNSFFPEMKKNRMIRILVQFPGQCIPTHVDTFVTYRNLYPEADLSKITRICAFVSPWHWGHFFHYGTTILPAWQSGNFFKIEPGVPHGSANSGFLPKVTIQWDGIVE